jgi:hypothetical protein
MHEVLIPKQRPHSLSGKVCQIPGFQRLLQNIVLVNVMTSSLPAMDLFSARDGQAMAEDNTYNVLFGDNVFIRSRF